VVCSSGEIHSGRGSVVVVVVIVVVTVVLVVVVVVDVVVGVVIVIFGGRVTLKSGQRKNWFLRGIYLALNP